MSADVKFQIAADSSGAQAAVTAFEAKTVSAMATAEKATEKLSVALVEQEAKLKAEAQAVLKLTDAEKRYLAASVGAEAAVKSKALALGVSTGKVREMEAALKKAAPAQEAVTRAAADGAEKVTNLGDRAGQLGNKFQKLAGFASMVSPEFGEIVRGGADVADVFEVAGGASTGLLTKVTALVPLLAIAAAGFVSMYKVVDTYAESKREAIRVNAQFAETMKPLDEALESARAEQALLTQAQGAGKDELKEYLAVADIHAGVDAKVAESTAALREELAALRFEQAQLGNRNSLDARLGRERIKDINAEIDQAEAKGNELKNLMESSRGLREALEGQAKGEEKVGVRTKEATDTLREQNDAMAESMALAKANAATFAGAVGGLDGAAQTQAAERLNGEEKVQAALRVTIADYEKMRDTALAVAETTEARETAEQAFRVARVEAERNTEAEIAAIREEAAKKAADLEASRLEKQKADGIGLVNQIGGYARDGLSVLSDSLDKSYGMSADMASRLETQLAESEQYLTDAQKQGLEARIAAQKDAAAKQFEAAKTAKSAEAVASTALAAINAIAQSPPPSPFGLIGAGIATAAGVAAVAQIQSQKPSFHSGTSMVQARGNMAADEVSATLLKREAVLNPGAADRLGRDNIDALNAGMGGGGGQYRLQVVMGHKILDEPVARTLRMGGRLQREVAGSTQNGPVGHGRR